jgi:DNA adenine methylase
VSTNSDSHGESATTTLKWVGGKRRIAKEISGFFPEKFETYFEPFAGGASIFFHLMPKKAVLSDLNSSLINYYTQLRDRPRELIEVAIHIQDTFNSLDGQEAKKLFFYEYRNRFNADTSKSDVMNAADFLFLNKTAFNGLYRENAKGEFNVPFNNTKILTLFKSEQMLQNSSALSGVKLSIADFRKSASDAKSGDLVYFDPPYVPLSNTSSFTDYTKSAFGPEAQELLRDTANELRKKGVTVVISNSYSEIVRNLYTEFELHELNINRLVAASSNSRGEVKEYVIVGHPIG